MLRTIVEFINVFFFLYMLLYAGFLFVSTIAGALALEKSPERKPFSLNSLCRTLPGMCRYPSSSPLTMNP